MPERTKLSQTNGLERYLDIQFHEVYKKLDGIEAIVNTHMQGEGHELLSQRIRSLEKNQDEEETYKRGRPLTTWQIAAGIIGILISLSFLFFTVLSFLLSLFSFIHLYLIH